MRPWDAEAVRRAMQVYLVMGSVNTTQDPVEVLRQAIAGGITLFQFREKELAPWLAKLASRLQCGFARCAASTGPVHRER